MSKPFVPKAGTTAECAAFTGLENEVVLDEEKGSLIVHDGVTAGGAHEILPKDKNDEIYLSRSGGTMTGSIFFHPTEENMCSTDDGGVTFHGGRGYNHGGYIKAYGKDAPNAPGAVELYASDGTNASALLAWPDGRLVWRGNTVITSAGGTLNNAICYTGNVLARKTTNDSYLVFQGGSNWDYGSYLQLNGSENSGGASDFSLASRLNGNHVELRGTNGGSLKWLGQEIERVVSWDNSLSSTSGHIRYANGLQICFGALHASTSGAQVTYSAPFLSAWARILISRTGGTSGGGTDSSFISSGNKTTTGFKMYGSSGVYCDWLAIGTWK